MRNKTATYGDRKIIKYDSFRWKLLKQKRSEAVEIMQSLRDFSPVVYGSVARGDVNENSDIDVFIPILIPSYRVEIALDNFGILDRRIVQATPNYAIKGELVLSERTTVSFPLVRIKERELDFYKFGGSIGLSSLLENKRVPGVDKRLVMIAPIDEGHQEIPLNEMGPEEVAKILEVKVDIVDERIRVLEKRREVGRTGVFLLETLHSEESFESALKAISERNPYVKRRLKG